MTDTSEDQRWLERAVTLAYDNVGEGGGPFGAVVVADGVEIGTGQNRVTRDNDPTAHAEVLAIRAACKAKGDFSLAGATLYTSCEPCPLCMSSALWARVDRILYAADRDDAAAGGFDDREFYELFTRDRATWPVTIESHPTKHDFAPFDRWLQTADRSAY